MSTRWSDIQAAWSASWSALSARAAMVYAAALQSDPSGTVARINGFTSALQASRASLDRMQAHLPNPPVTEADRALVARHQELEKRWHELAAGLFADATPVSTTPVVGVAPALVVGGLAITAVGLSWAFAAHEYAVNLQEQTALAERELDARVAASQQGRALPPSTLPAPSSVDGARSVGLWLFGGLVLAAGALVVPLLLERRGA